MLTGTGACCTTGASARTLAGSGDRSGTTSPDGHTQRPGGPLRSSTLSASPPLPSSEIPETTISLDGPELQRTEIWLAEHAVRGVQNGRAAPRRVSVSAKVTSDEARVLTIFARRDGDDEQVRVEGAKVFDAEELELERAFGEVVQRAEGGFGGDAKIT